MNEDILRVNTLKTFVDFIHFAYKADVDVGQIILDLTKVATELIHIYDKIQRALSTLDGIENTEERNSKTTEIMNSINELTINLMISTIEYIKVPDATVFEKDFIREFLTSCDKNTHNKIKEQNIELRKSTEVKPLQMKCINCNHEYSQPFNINVSNFFD